MKIKKARDAINKELGKLEKKDAWPYETVREKSDVIRENKANKTKAHFGQLMILCHIKNAQPECDLWEYKGRLVFRGDQVKDEDGKYAVFSEQGTCASHLMAARFVDAIAHMPGMSGEDADATGAYTQTQLGPECPTTWITLPKDRWPKEWFGKYTEPVVELRTNLYGHPLAGLFWEKHCQFLPCIDIHL